MRRVRFAVRNLAKTPVLTLVVVLSLGLGIGANTAIFSLLYQIILRSLPVEKPEELVLLTSPGETKGGRNSTDNSGGMDFIFNYETLRALEESREHVTSVAGFRRLGANLSFENQTVDGEIAVVSGGYFPTLGATPTLGRAITPEDDIHGAGNPVAVLSYGYWQNRLGGRPEVLNKSIRINARAFTVVGVAPKGFTGLTLGDDPDAYVPISLKAQLTPGWDGTDRFRDYWIYLFARLRSEATMPQAEASLNSIYGGLMEEHAKLLKGHDDAYVERFRTARITLLEGNHGQSSLREQGETPLLILMGATGLVLLIAMANAANLLLARSAQRRKELAIRTALGASRMEIMGQMLTEATLLSAAGGLAGIVLASWTVSFLINQMEHGEVVYYISAGLQWQVLLFALAVSLVTGLLFGLHPAWVAARQSVGGVLKDDSGTSSSSRGSVRARKVLVAMQVGVSALLLVQTGLFLKSLVNLLAVDLGMRTENILSFRVAPRLNGYTSEQSTALYERIEAEMAAIPGVRSVASSSIALVTGSNWGNDVTVEGYPRGSNVDNNSRFSRVGSGFFSKMGIPLIAGREFTERDNRAGGKVAVVNQTFVDHFLADRNPIGRKFALGGGSDIELDVEIVGVTKDSTYSSVKQKVPRIFYIPWRQVENQTPMSFYVRSDLEPGQMSSQLRRVMASIDPDLPMQDLRTFEEQIRRSIGSEQLVLQLAAAFAGLATLMAMLGLYGVMAHSVTRRSRELGIRQALGADAGRIRALIMREVLIILAAGLAAGVPAALALGQVTESQLFEVEPLDATVTMMAVAALTTSALLAGFLPARRATRINPVEALRYE